MTTPFDDFIDKKRPRERQTLTSQDVGSLNSVLGLDVESTGIDKTAKLHGSNDRQQADDTSMVKYGDQADDEGV